MHIVHYYQRGKVRTSAEKRVRRMNTIVIALEVALLIYSSFQFVAVSSDTVSTENGLAILSNSNFRLKAAACSTVQRFSRTPFSYDITIDGNSLPLLVYHMLNSVQLSLIAIGVYVFVGIVNKVLFEFNVRKVQIRSFAFWKSSVGVIELSLLVASYLILSDSNGAAAAVRAHYNSCNLSGSLHIPFHIPQGFSYAVLALATLWDVVLLIGAIYNGLKACRLDDPDLVFDEYGDVVCRKDGDPLSATDIENNHYHKPRISTEDSLSPPRHEAYALTSSRHHDPAVPLPQRRAPPFQDRRRNAPPDELNSEEIQPRAARPSNARFAHVGAMQGRRYN